MFIMCSGLQSIYFGYEAKFVGRPNIATEIKFVGVLFLRCMMIEMPNLPHLNTLSEGLQKY